MKLQPTISKTIFYSFLFAIGGSPTLAMLVIYGQEYHEDFFMTAFYELVGFVRMCVNSCSTHTKIVIYSGNEKVLILKRKLKP